MNKNILEIREMLDNGYDDNKLIDDTLENVHELQNECNAFVTICDDAYKESDCDNILSGIPYVVKDNISTKDILSTGSSNTLKDYVPFFDATVIEKLKSCGAINIGKTVLDELGMGGTGTTGHTGVVKNPWDKNRITAGSSAGSACAVASGIVPFALGSDTGDSIRKPAAYCGTVGYKPTYGMISRYGLFPFASSLDHIGVLTRNVKDAAIVVNNVKGIDKKDMTSIDSKYIDLVESIDDELVNKKLVVIKELIDINNYENPSNELKEILNNFNETLNRIRSLGVVIEETSIDKKLLNALFPTYICISCAEATSNYSNLTGIIFGPKGNGENIRDIIKDHRTKGFSTLIKRRFIIGSYVLQKENQEKYFLNACRVRKMIVDKINEILKNYDAIVLPCSGKIAPKFDEMSNVISKEPALENHLVIGNFGGFPSITIPNGFVDNMPTGINFTGRVLDDANILQIANKVENILGYKDQIAKEWK